MCGVMVVSLLALHCQFFHIIALGQPHAHLTERGAASKVLCSHKSWWLTTRCTEEKTEAKAQTYKETPNYQEGRNERKGWKTQFTKTSWFVFFFTLIAGCNYQGEVLQSSVKEISLWTLWFSVCFSAVKSRGGTAILQWQQGAGQNHGKER